MRDILSLMSSEKVCQNLEFLKFNGKWRQYQQRVLSELEQYLDDKKLNVVAAPGAGKTTLGIEVIARLGNPALIIAPSITIRNQWKQRICDAFLENPADENLISLDPKDVKPITVITYQLLHSVFKYQETLDNFVSELKRNNIKTIVLDEAHHLRTEWFLSVKHLTEILEDEDFRTVSLTGTPPYDVSFKEWNNYHSLCGPVDVEISIPELVKQGDLCPHQDLIWFSELDENDRNIISDFDNNRKSFFEFLNNEAKFYSCIKTSALLDDLEKNIEAIYEDTNFTVSTVSYLFSHDEMDITANTVMNFLCLERENIPQWNYVQAEILLSGMLGNYSKYFICPKLIKEKLKEFNLFETAKKVNLTESPNLKKVFAKSINKINSIKQITELEYSIMNNDLREVVLLDYIGSENLGGLNVLSVFAALKNENFNTAILTGSLVVIPKSAKSDLDEIVKIKNISEKNLIISEYEEKYLKVDTRGSLNIVSLVTELFNNGKINVLVGTQALLGEGWDSPSINSLVIASVIGSFMLSNQMRGRAIRVDKNNPDKKSNIWHLVSLSDIQNYDMELMQNRFKTFEGISFIDNTIQNGIERLGLNCAQSLNCNDLNEIFIQRAKSRENMKSMWTQVFEQSVLTEGNFVSQIYSVIKNEKPKMPVLLVKNQENILFKKIFIPIFMKYKTSKKQKYTNVLINGILTALCETGIIKTPRYKIRVKNFVSSDYTPYVTLSNCTNYEREVFIGIFSELYSTADNQRYILKHEDKYLTVPDIIGTNKKQVKLFAKYIEPYFGYLDIIFTRSPKGRQELLKAKYNTLIDETVQTSRIWI